MNLKRLIALVCATLLMVGLLSGCGTNTNTEGTANQPAEKQNITINGSTSVQPLSEELAQGFKTNNANATIDIQAGGSGVGIKSALDGVVDIGMSSRELKEEEKSLKEYKIAVDGIAVIVNPTNIVKDLSMEQIMKIYNGEITDWSEVGGKAGKITVVTREEGSGTRGAFIELTGLEVKEGDNKVDKTTATAITQGSTGAVMTTVASDPNAIGYASYGSAKVKTDVSMLSINGVACTDDNIYAGTYKISRPFLMLTKSEPTGLAKTFLDFILSAEGQEIVAKNGYLKVN